MRLHPQKKNGGKFFLCYGKILECGGVLLIDYR